MRIVLLISVLVATVIAAFAYAKPARFAQAAHVVAGLMREPAASPARTVDIARGRSGDFSLKASINGIAAPMVVDTGATSVVLTHETARAIGLPLEMLTYNIEVETAAGPTRAARVTLDRLGIGGLVERSVPALVVPAGRMKANLLGMSFLDRLESWEVRADRVRLRGYP
ncbi:MAG: TIGR02281 family clan AA aspartic protease [Xanthobacteraceae bacterium]|nr:MAG: TIGR02281 family clan AA aspartic protease [Xanthobacteraceae bacterium]